MQCDRHLSANKLTAIRPATASICCLLAWQGTLSQRIVYSLHLFPQNHALVNPEYADTLWVRLEHWRQRAKTSLVREDTIWRLYQEGSGGCEAADGTGRPPTAKLACLRLQRGNIRQNIYEKAGTRWELDTGKHPIIDIMDLKQSS